MSKFWIAGKHTVLKALENNNNKIYKILLSNEKNLNFINKNFHKNVQITNQIEIKNILKNYEDINHQGYLALIERKYKPIIEDALNEKNIIILDGINDQRNIGAIIRTACAFNIKNIIVNKKDIILNNLLLNKTASGGVELVNIIIVSNILNSFKILKKNNYCIYGFDGKAKNIFNRKIINKKNALVFGSENLGLKKLTKQSCDYLVKIQINEQIDSLNVSASVASALTTLKVF